MTTVKNIYDLLCGFAPLELKMDFDNPGLLVGHENREVRCALISLDITDEVIEEAKRAGAQLIVSHHPLFFSLKRAVDSDESGRKVLALAEAGIAAICMHTNLDKAPGGVNDMLAQAAGLQDIEVFDTQEAGYDAPCGLGRIGVLEPSQDMKEYLPRLKKALGANGLRYVDSGKPVHKVAVLGGSGGDMLFEAAALGCDTYITADVKYNGFLSAKELGINLIDGGHFCTETVVVPKLASLIGKAFPAVDIVISKHRQTEQFI